MTEPITFDFDSVTPRMLVDFKAKTGQSLMSLVGADGTMDMAKMDEELIAGFIWLSLRMSGRPDATWDEALDTPFSSVDFVEEPPALDPTNAGNES